jgi:hypothetical protein
LLVAEDYVLVASTCVISNGALFVVKSAYTNGDEYGGIIRAIWVNISTAVAGEYFVFSHSFFVDFGLNLGLLESTSLTLVVTNKLLV